MPYKDPDKRRQFHLDYNRSDKMREWFKNHYQSHKNRYRAQSRTDHIKKYGISVADFNAMVDAQAGLCGICTLPMSPGGGTCIDHDHETGRVRSLLCRKCNTGIGHLRDDILTVSSAVNYLEVHSG